MDFYTNIHKSRGDKGSSITGSSDTVSPHPPSIIHRWEEQIPPQMEAALKARRPQPPGPGREVRACTGIICWKCLSLWLK